jgi:hypothetical protein
VSKKKPSRFIPGIFNYCDRWCERCAFTQRCRSFAMEAKMKARPADENQDARNEEFWDDLATSFGRTSEMIHEMAEEMDVDFSEESLEETSREIKRKEKIAARLGASVLQTAEAYAWRLRDYIKQHPALAPGNDEAGSTADAHPAASLLQDAMEVILWHQFFIMIKLKRAFHSLVEEKEEPRDWPRDSEGTAKVALIGVDRCIAAWAVVRDQLPAHGDAALDFMLRLDRLRNKVEAEFPKARAFVRPGFDE